jgi:hypothetical protein
MEITNQLRWAAVILAAACSNLLAQQNQVVSVGYRPLLPNPASAVVAPGEVVTLFTTVIDVPDAVAKQTPLPTTLSGVSVLVRVVGAWDTRGYPTSLPILRITRVDKDPNDPNQTCKTDPNTTVLCSHSEITVQIPTEGVCAYSGPGAPRPCPANPPFSQLPPLLILNVKANGVTGPDLPLVLLLPSHLLDSCDAVFGPQPSYTCHPLVTHADGTMVSTDSPARVGETITIYATGLASLSPGGPPTGTAPAKPASVDPSLGTVFFKYPYPLQGYGPNVDAETSTKVTPEWVGLTGGYVGLYQINVRVPPAPGGVYPPCYQFGNSLGGNIQVVPVGAYGVFICVQP